MKTPAKANSLASGSQLASERAFPSHPRVDRYFGAGSVEEARARVMRCVERGDGPALVIGGPGMGKTMLLGVLEESLRDRFKVASLASTQLCTRRALLQAVLHGLGQPYRGRDEGEVRLALATFLENRQECPNGAVLLVDEAQALPSRLLEELRILSNLARDGEPLVRLVLAGSAALEEQFAAPALEAFNQRLAARAYLGPLNHAETCQYVRAHVAAAGADPDALFAGEALDAIYSASDGVPRLINQVCDRAILEAVGQGAANIDAGMIQAAWSDLHQLPAPWYTPASAEPNAATAPIESDSGVLEFGMLDSAQDDSINDATASENAENEELTSAQSLATSNAPVQGDWNADASLSELPVSTKPTQQIVVGTDNVDEPTVMEEDLETQPAAGGFSNDSDLPMPAKMPVNEHSLENPTPQSAPVADADALFGQGFDEEEVVLDRFASLEEVFTPTTPAVVNSQDATFSDLVRDVAPEQPYEEPAEQFVAFSASVDESERFDESETNVEPAVLSLTGSERESQAGDLVLDEEMEDEIAESVSELSESMKLQLADKGCGSCAGACSSKRSIADNSETEPDILVIEPDAAPATVALPTARRQDYSQLFAKLRQS